MDIFKGTVDMFKRWFGMSKEEMKDEEVPITSENTDEK